MVDFQILYFHDDHDDDIKFYNTRLDQPTIYIEQQQICDHTSRMYNNLNNSFKDMNDDKCFFKMIKNWLVEKAFYSVQEFLNRSTFYFISDLCDIVCIRSIWSLFDCVNYMLICCAFCCKIKIYPSIILLTPSPLCASSNQDHLSIIEKTTKA